MSKKIKNISIITLIIIISIFLLSKTALGQRLYFPVWLVEKVRTFFAANPSLSAADYRDGTILLIKPIATGTGEGAYQAGDIVEIRDGEELYKKFGHGNFLGAEERTRLLPVYYKGKLTEGEKQKLLEPAYTDDAATPNEALTPPTPLYKGGNKGDAALTPLVKGGQGGLVDDNKKMLSRPTDTKVMVGRRQVGVDYTKFLSTPEIIKVRQFEQLKGIPEIDLSMIIEKGSGLTFNENQNDKNNFCHSGLRAGIQCQTVQIMENVWTNKLVHTALSWILGSSPRMTKEKDDKGVVILPKYLQILENAINKTKQIAEKIIKPVMAGVAETVKVVDPGNGTGADYTSLNDWEAAMQDDITAADANTISVAKCRATGGIADTATVTISGWTADATHYIKIWTDPGENFRHSGKYDTTKYRLETISGNSIQVNNYFTRIEGLQVKSKNAGGDWQESIGTGGVQTAVDADLRISNNIITRTADNLANSSQGIMIGIFPNSGSKVLIYNNIVYDFGTAAANSAGIMIQDNNGNNRIFAYNNTVASSSIGFAWQVANSGIAKNNIAQDCTNGYNGTFGTGSNYNISDVVDDNTGGGNDKTGTEVYFRDFDNDDFHLAPTDTAAKGAGVNLSADANLAFTYDIDGQGRPSGTTAFDIGADQMVATNIYRSVGPGNTTALATGGSNAMTISGTTATFATSLPGNVGVGDVIQYATSTGAVNSLAFIAGRTDSTHYTVQDVAGHTASSTSANTGWSLFRAYTSLHNALDSTGAGTENTGIADSLENFDTWSNSKNLASSTEAWNVALYGDAADTLGVNVSGWTTSTSTSVKIYTPNLPSEVGVSQRHSGKWDSSKYNMTLSDSAGTTAAIGPNINHLWIDGLQINQTWVGTNSHGISTESSMVNIKVSNNIIKFTGSWLANDHIAIQVLGLNSRDIKVWNNIIHNWNEAVYLGNAPSGYNANVAYNNTVDTCTTGIQGTGWDYAWLLVKNNITRGCTNGFADNLNASSNYNVSDVAGDAPGANSKNGYTVQFADAANDDFHLRSGDSTARGAGVNLSADANLAFNMDIDGQFRPENGPWDIGADEAMGAQINKPLTNLMNDSSLILYYSFDGSTINGIVLTDLSDSGINGILAYDPKKAPGISGQALSFDGVDDYVDLQAFALTADKTISFWIKHKITGTTASFETILECGNDAPWIGFNPMGAGLPPKIELYDNNPLTATTISQDVWYHIVYTSNSSGNVSQFYVNGVADGSPGTANTQTSNACSLGDSNDSATNSIIDDFRIYNRTFSAAEVLDLYNKSAAKMQVATPPGSGKQGLVAGLVGYWSFDGSAMGSTSATDLSNNNNTGWLINGAKKVIGKIGQALYFDGADDHVRARTSDSLKPTTQLSISAWMKLDNDISATGRYPIVVKDRYEVADSGYALFAYEYDGANAAFEINEWGGDGQKLSATIKPSPGVWYHVVGTYNAAGQMRIYFNGALDNSAESTEATILYTWDYDFIIGSATPGRESYFKGIIDEVRVYNRELSAEEVSQLYQQSAIKTKFKKY